MASKIPSISAKICLLLKCLLRAAPLGQNPEQLPQPLHRASLTTEIPRPLVELDGRIGAKAYADLTSGATVRIDPGNGRFDLDLTRGSQGKGFGRGPGSMGDRVRHVPGRLAGSGQEYAVRGCGKRGQFGVFFQEKPVPALADAKGCGLLPPRRSGLPWPDRE